MIGALGINVRLLYTGVFAVGAWLGGLGGVIAAPMGAIYPGMDLDIIIDAFIVVVIGGLGSLAGTVLGALILGCCDLSAFCLCRSLKHCLSSSSWRLSWWCARRVCWANT